MTQTFDALEIDINTQTGGTHLIEASAGTGKTFGIASLFTRLIVLENIKIEKIAVLTFTKAATAELKTRLRSRLVSVRSFLENNQQTEDKFLQDLFAKAKKIDKAELLKRTKTALNDFDQAGIYTIHAFCRSILNENAFDCRVPFALEMQSTDDDNELKQKLAEDFWRKKIANNQTAALICFNNEITPEKILDDIKSYISQPLLNKENISFKQCIDEIETIHKKLCALEIEVTDDLIAQIEQNYCSDKTAKGLFNDLRPRIKELGTNQLEILFLQIRNNLDTTYDKRAFVPLFENLQKIIKNLPFDIEKIDKKPSKSFIDKNPNKTFNIQKHFLNSQNLLLKNNSDDLSPFKNFNLIDEYISAYQNFINNLGFFLLNYLDTEIKETKKLSNKRNYNDLLLDVYFSLKNTNLTKHLSQKYAVLMVDEFQDTDSVQYAIFQQSFIDKKQCVFFVGDPKQAIYRFRGADIYAYLNAAEKADHLYSMDTNYRTHEKLVNVCNALFNIDNAFLNNKISFSPVLANRKEEHISGSLKEKILPQALTVLAIDDEKTTADEQRQAIADICANHIAQVLNGGLFYQERPLSARDIAILVRSHNEADIMRKSLKNKGIDSVSLSKQSVFDSDEAKILYALMKFWLNPASENGLWRFVQMSNLIGKNIQEIQKDENISQDIANAHSYRTKWEKQGLFAAYQAFNEDYQISCSLIQRQEWRILTNIAQVIELLAEEEKNCFGTHALLQFLKQQIAQLDSNDESKLRLESDENLVKIITMHASKGLEYPIVYCPFIFRPHDEKVQDFEIIHQNDLSGSLKHKTQVDNMQIKNDLLAEQVRLLYVALTRATEALIVGCGGNSQANSSINYLLRQNEKEVPQKELWQNWLMQHADLSAKLLDGTELPKETVFRQPENETPHYSAKQLGTINLKRRQFSSFSAWQSQTHSEENLVVDNAERQVVSDLSNENNPLNNFPAGVNTGLCWHEILEEFYFNVPAKQQKDLIINKLEKYAFSLDAVENMLTLCERVRLAQLNHGVSLSQTPFRLPESQFLLNELNFQPEIVLKTNIGKGLPDIIRHALQRVEKTTVQGFFNGFIDMLTQDAQGNVYVIDYKSNKLPSYDEQAMNAAMAQHHYAVQALIYAIAIRRMFAIRNIHPEKLYVRYLFLRGLNEHNQNGIWAWDIDCNILKKLENELSVHKIQAA